MSNSNSNSNSQNQEFYLFHPEFRIPNKIQISISISNQTLTPISFNFVEPYLFINYNQHQYPVFPNPHTNLQYFSKSSSPNYSISQCYGIPLSGFYHSNPSANNSDKSPIKLTSVPMEIPHLLQLHPQNSRKVSAKLS